MDLSAQVPEKANLDLFDPEGFIFLIPLRVEAHVQWVDQNVVTLQSRSGGCRQHLDLMARRMYGQQQFHLDES